MMKNKFPSAFLYLLFFCIGKLNAQNTGAVSENNAFENSAFNPCITSQEYEVIEKRCEENTKALRQLNPLNKKGATGIVTLSWPLKAASGLKDCSFYYVSAYVDQNTGAGSIQDFSCGNNTYDGHTGTDISTWPFNFYKMDNNLVEVIAAAPGTIIDKHDGEFDRNCATNTLTANYIIVEHSDGARAMYWHMKKNSLTSKSIGQTVATGEFLGVVGSSGNSSGPHLHFEVWNGSDKSKRIDPFSGTCNTLNANSWWTNQKPYKETAVIRATVHTTDVVIPACPTTETLNESTSYTIPFQGPGLAPGYAKFYMFLRNEVSGLNADLSILNPDGTTFNSWTYNSTADSKSKIWGFSKKLPTAAGKYTFKASYNGTICTSTFDVINPSAGVKNVSSPEISVYPNPSGGNFYIEGETIPNLQIVIYNLVGTRIFEAKINQPKIELSPNLSSGIYYYRLVANNLSVSSGKLFVK